MPRPQYETVVASAPKMELKTADLSTSIGVNPGQQYDVDVYPSPGTIGVSQSAAMQVNAPEGATSGTHGFLASSTLERGGYVYGLSSFDKNVFYNRKMWITANDREEPQDGAGQALAFVDNHFDNESGFRFRFENNTNVVHFEPKTIWFTWIERQIGGK